MQKLDKSNSADSLRVYTVKQVAQLLELSPHTLRAWERRYRAIVPERTASGRRHYSGAEVARLRALGELVREGHRISELARLRDEELSSLRQRYRPEIGTAISRGQAELSRHVSALLKALREFRLADLAQQLEWARVALSCRDFVLSVVSPLMTEVGDEVERGRLSVAQEHALSSVVRDQIGHILQVLRGHRRREGADRLVVLATPEGDRHELGILLSAVLCAYYGIPAYQLGASLPPADLIHAVKSLGARLVILGTTPLPPDEPTVSFPRYFRALAEGLPRAVEVWIGGEGEVPAQPLPRHVVRRVLTLAQLDDMLQKEM